MFKKEKKKINQPAPYFFANQKVNLTIYFMWPKSSAYIDVLYDLFLMKRKTLKHMHLC